ncbi:MAG: FAD binding domain-containing protein [Acidiferrobacteraceae bacterium]
MEPFRYLMAHNVEEAIDALHAQPSAMLLAGGTNLVDMMRLGILAPETLIDISRLPLREITVDGDGSVRIGALSSNADVAWHPIIRDGCPIVSEALLQGASPQIRNMASIAGNLLQRTRCAYFRDPSAHCNKRVPGAGCDARSGYHRMHAMLGVSESCIAANPSDLAVALTALDATLEVSGPAGSRVMPLVDFYRLPGVTPDQETLLARDEIIVYVRIPPSPQAARGGYLKVRDRASFEFSVASVACEVVLDGEGIAQARLALGGVGVRPWRSHEAEELLAGTVPERSLFERAADVLLGHADPLPGNAFKLPLARQLIVRALTTFTGTQG